MTTLTFGSLCSGIEAASVAWEPLGMKPLWFSEIESFCCDLLSQRYPSVPNLGDMESFGHANAVDVIVGGTPCQSFSVNGFRKGLADARGNLALRFAQIVRAIRPRWIIWENVPHVLRTNGGRDFGSILGALAQCGYGLAYRVLDSRYFGVAQRRRRVFVVGCLGNSAAGFAALFDGEAVCGDQREAPKSWPRPMARNDGWTGDTTPKRGDGITPTLRSGQGGEGVGVMGDGERPRKLTITEWERLQGFPDGYTAIIRDGKQASDAQRRRAIGNSFPVPVVRWIGNRILQIESMSRCLAM